MLTHCLKTVQQAVDFMELMDDSLMVAKVDVAPSTIGRHLRHIADHFSALVQGEGNELVDYEARSRDSLMESCRETCRETFVDIQQWLMALKPEDLPQTLLVRTDVGIGEALVTTLPSTLARELAFVCSHAVHHYAIIRIIAQALGCETDRVFGLAPSTATFERNQCAP